MLNPTLSKRRKTIWLLVALVAGMASGQALSWFFNGSPGEASTIRVAGVAAQLVLLGGLAVFAPFKLRSKPVD